MSDLSTVFVDDFDRGVITTLGGELVTVTVDGRSRQEYAVVVAGLDSGLDVYAGKVPVQFMLGADRLVEHIYPSIVVRRVDPEGGYDRAAWWGRAKKVPADGAVAVDLVVTAVDGSQETVSGFDRYAVQWRAEQWNIPYDVHVFAQTQGILLKLVRHVLRVIAPPSFPVTVMDSEGDERQYDAVDVAMSNTSELVEIGSRKAAQSWSFVLRAELDVHDTWEVAAMTTPEVNVEPIGD